MRAAPYTKRIALCGLFGALLVIAQVSLAFIPNVELVSLLIIIITLLAGRYALWPIGIFVIAQALIYGFGLWVINYIYIWPLLFFITLPFKGQKSPLFFAFLSGGFGLCFGALCSLPYLFIGGFASAFAYFIAGLSFDLLHCAGNAILALVLFKPLYNLGHRLLKDIF